jgi:hypothetical protein
LPFGAVTKERMSTDRNLGVTTSNSLTSCGQLLSG